MASKNQIDSVYNPEKSALKEKVVIGISGGIDSLVAAYLLKIQKFDLFALTILPSWDQFSGNKSKTIACFITDEKLNFINEFCQQLNIPHEFVKLTSEFQAKVVDKWVTSKITGSYSHTCWDCHDLRMKVLYQKMKDLKAQSIATGHYAKIFHHASHDTYYVHSSNDEVHDQSGLLSRLPSEIIHHLKLPLSDLQKKEVVKLAKNFGIDDELKTLEIHKCFPTNPETLNFIKTNVPAGMVSGGEMMNEDASAMYADHDGVYKFDNGKSVDLGAASRSQQLFLAKYFFKEKKVIITTENFFLKKEVLLINCRFSEEVSWPEPLKGFVHLKNKEFVDCWIYPKCLDSAFIVMENKHKIFANDVVVLYKNKGKNSKVLLSGIAKYLSPVPEEVEGELEGENKKANFNRARDF